MNAVGDIGQDVQLGHHKEPSLVSGDHKLIELTRILRPVDQKSFNTTISNYSQCKLQADPEGLLFCRVTFPDKESMLAERFITPIPVHLGELFLESFGNREQKALRYTNHSLVAA